jgi:hypothetical protein
LAAGTNNSWEPAYIRFNLILRPRVLFALQYNLSRFKGERNVIGNFFFLYWYIIAGRIGVGPIFSALAHVTNKGSPKWKAIR